MTDERLLRYFAIGLSALGIGLLYHTYDADAQQQRCAPFVQMRDSLKERYNETNSGVGIVNEKSVAVLFRSPGGETWTIALLDSNGIACAVAAGTDWSQSEIEKGEPS